MESKWLKSLQYYLFTINGTIELDTNIIQPLQHIHDWYLMDAVLATDQFTPKQVCMIHYCWLYLQVLTLSDITLANGTALDPALYQGQQSILATRHDPTISNKTSHPQQRGSNGNKHAVSGVNLMVVYTNRLELGYTDPINSDANGLHIKTPMVISTFPTQVDMTGIQNTKALIPFKSTRTIGFHQPPSP
jgi:hypothetical protein